ncbi:unnamed protein product [Discula destructiva]
MRGLVAIALSLVLTSTSALMPSFLPADAVPAQAECGNAHFTDAEAAAYRTRSLGIRQDPANNSTTIAVDVYFHIASTAAEPNLITDANIEAQFAVLRDTYKRYGIALTLQSTDRVVDDLTATGFYGADQTIGDNWDAYIAYLQATRKGGYDALNMYFYTNMTRSLSGSCALPTFVTEGDEFFYRDGCQINAATMPGLAAGYALAGQALGHAAIHEAGHWFGLLHTFQGGCGDGDGVSDTPAQLGSSKGCPVGRDSCPDQPGLDAIHNFMDYSSDEWCVPWNPFSGC